MSAASMPSMRRAGPRTRAAAALVLIALAALAYYALFSGPTTYSVPSSPRAAPARTAPPPGEEPEGGGERPD
jgi:hypothetical protein